MYIYGCTCVCLCVCVHYMHTCLRNIFQVLKETFVSCSVIWWLNIFEEIHKQFFLHLDILHVSQDLKQLRITQTLAGKLNDVLKAKMPQGCF